MFGVFDAVSGPVRNTVGQAASHGLGNVFVFPRVDLTCFLTGQLDHSGIYSWAFTRPSQCCKSERIEIAAKVRGKSLFFLGGGWG